MNDESRACSAGHHNGVDAVFCSTCGEKLTTEAEAQFDAPLAAASPPATQGQGSQGPLPTSSQGVAATEYDSDPTSPHALHPAAAESRGRRALPLIIGAAVVVILGAFLLNMMFGSSTTTLRGTATLTDTEGDIDGSWDSCEGTGGYSDFSAGAGLSIRGRNGEIVGSGSVKNVDDSVMRILAEQEARDAGTDASDGSDWRALLQAAEGIMCMLYFEAEVEESDYYSVEIASRGALEYSRSELEESDYFIQLSLGG